MQNNFYTLVQYDSRWTAWNGSNLFIPLLKLRPWPKVWLSEVGPGCFLWVRWNCSCILQEKARMDWTSQRDTAEPLVILNLLLLGFSLSQLSHSSAGVRIEKGQIILLKLTNRNTYSASTKKITDAISFWEGHWVQGPVYLPFGVGTWVPEYSTAAGRRAWREAGLSASACDMRREYRKLLTKVRLVIGAGRTAYSYGWLDVLAPC